MTSFDTKFETLLREIIKSERDERAEDLMTGNAHSFDEYRERVGYLRALTDVETWCAQVAKKMNEER